MIGWIVAGAVSVFAVSVVAGYRTKLSRSRVEVSRQIRLRMETEDKMVRQRMVLRGMGLWAASEAEFASELDDRQRSDEIMRYVADRLRQVMIGDRDA